MHDIVRIVVTTATDGPGGGYPDGPSRNDIPLDSRILAAADSLDAMPSDRSYRASLSAAQAAAELSETTGASSILRSPGRRSR